jgi:hypothetical protein
LTLPVATEPASPDPPDSPQPPDSQPRFAPPPLRPRFPTPAEATAVSGFDPSRPLDPTHFAASRRPFVEAEASLPVSATTSVFDPPSPIAAMRVPAAPRVPTDLGPRVLPAPLEPSGRQAHTPPLPASAVPSATGAASHSPERRRAILVALVAFPIVLTLVAVVWWASARTSSGPAGQPAVASSVPTGAPTPMAAPDLPAPARESPRERSAAGQGPSPGGESAPEPSAAPSSAAPSSAAPSPAAPSADAPSADAAPTATPPAPTPSAVAPASQTPDPLQGQQPDHPTPPPPRRAPRQKYEPEGI